MIWPAATVPLSHALGLGQWDTSCPQRDTSRDAQWDTPRTAAELSASKWDRAWDTQWDSIKNDCPKAAAHQRSRGTPVASVTVRQKPSQISAATPTRRADVPSPEALRRYRRSMRRLPRAVADRPALISPPGHSCALPNDLGPARSVTPPSPGGHLAVVSRDVAETAAADRHCSWPSSSLRYVTAYRKRLAFGKPKSAAFSAQYARAREARRQ